MPASQWLRRVHVQTVVHSHRPKTKNTESIRQTDAMVNEAMHGWEGCQGVQMDFDVETFHDDINTTEEAKSPHTQEDIFKHTVHLEHVNSIVQK